MNKSNKLFEELLGDDASAFHNNKNNEKGKKDDGESTQMSSILGPILRDKESQNNKSSDNVPTPKSGKKIRNDVPPNNNNNGLGDLYSPRRNSGSNNQQQQLSHRNQHTTTQNNPQQQQQQNYEEDDEETLDTYMTKPRIIKFDSNSDDVSALFGGGGASQLGGVESYRGTYAKKRQGKGTGGGLVMGRSGRNIEENSRQTGRTGATSTFQSHGVNSILEEIGLRPSSSKKFSDMNEDPESEYTGKSRSTMFKNDNTDNMKIPASRRKRNANTINHQNKSGSKNMIVIIVGVIFITIQFTTVHKRDKATMQNMNWRFNNHKFATAPQGSNGLGGVNSMQRIRQMAEQQQNLGNQRRRGGTYDTEPNEDGLGDVLRKSVPLVNGQPVARKKKELWEREQERVLFDDQLDNLNTHDRNGNSALNQNNLRGGGGSQQLGDGTGNQMMKQQHQQIEQLQRDLEHHEQIQKHQIQMAIPKQQEPAVQQQAQQQQQQQLPPPPKPIQNIGDTHPLLVPQKGLSMSDAADKLGVASDKLSDIDPRPQQSLTNDIIPARFSVFADLKTPYVKGRDTPFFWHIPRSGGVIVKTMLSHCLRQTLAAEVGEMNGHADDPEIKVIEFAEHNYTNVNIATPEGISRALNLGLVPSHLADTIVSAHVDLIPSLFNANDQARAFVLLRHPVDRAASMFYFLKSTGYPPLKDMTVDDYAKSELIENNWLVRILSESMTGPIDMDNLEVAKEVLRRKFIVGLLDNKRGTFARFDHYFKWKDSPDYEKEFGCRKQLMDEKYVAKHPIRKDSDTWKLLHEQNRFDVHLYEFAKELFTQQSYIFGL